MCVAAPCIHVVLKVLFILLPSLTVITRHFISVIISESDTVLDSNGLF